MLIGQHHRYIHTYIHTYVHTFIYEDIDIQFITHYSQDNCFVPYHTYWEKDLLIVTYAILRQFGQHCKRELSTFLPADMKFFPNTKI